jgi:hypothetical protein
MAAAFLTKYTNAPLLMVVGLVAFLKLRPWWRQKLPRTQLVPVAWLLVASAIPIGLWLARNYLVLGELTGFALKSRHMTWTPKPIGQYWNHPIFTAHGCVCFWSALLSTLWRGELLWHRRELADGSMDAFYALSSTVFLLTFVVASVARARKTPPERFSATILCLLMVVLYVALLIFLSISMDFGSGVFGRPSREWPYFANGRMMLGALVPFLIVYLGGLEVLLGWLRIGFLRLPLLVVALHVIALSEIVYSMDVFASQYNWYHFP